MSQKPDYKAKGGGWKIEKVQGSQVCFLFTVGEMSMHPSYGEGASGEQWNWKIGVAGRGLASGAQSG